MLVENLRLALRSLSANKLRAALTMLGIAIGVAAVITLLAVGQGVSRYVTSQFEGLGTNLVFVFAGEVNLQSGPPGRSQGGAVLTQGDALALADPAKVPDALRVVPLIRRTVTAAAGGSSTSTGLRAVSPDYAAARN
jgi:putative ABC transport system permease protein